MHPDVDTVRGWVQAAERITVLTGAGISTDSGIPDFRGPQGVWTKNPTAEKLATIQHYLADPDVRRQAWRARADNPAFQATPNAGHLAVVELQRQGKLHAVVTQNVDGLHQRSGVAAELVVEVHGTIWWTRCWDCQDRRSMAETLDRVRAGEEDPSCDLCGGILKSDTISFGQALVPEVIERAMQVSQECDVLLAVGSTLSVYPAANCLPRAKAAGAKVVIINAEATDMDRLADAVLQGQIGDLLPAVVAPLPSHDAARWDERYAATDRLWSAEPNRTIADVVGPMAPGRALDLGAGEGRHAVWLASRGWQVTAVDFSRVGIERGRTMSGATDVDWVVDDVRAWTPPDGTRYDLVLVSYLHLAGNVLERVRDWLKPGGALVVLGHALRNLTDGVGGPQDARLLHTEEQLRSAATGLEVDQLGEVIRPTADGDAIDLLLVARRL